MRQSEPRRRTLFVSLAFASSRRARQSCSISGATRGTVSATSSSGPARLDLQLTEYGDGYWRATFYVTGQAHSIVGGSAWEAKPWTGAAGGVGGSDGKGGAGSRPRPRGASSLLLLGSGSPPMLWPRSRRSRNSDRSGALPATWLSAGKDAQPAQDWKSEQPSNR
jgi:hypothetical protein